MLNLRLDKVNQVFIPPDAHLAPKRRVDLDWLRVILFGLLIIHHVGMFYTSNWGWHAKSEYRSEWLESFLLIVEPWRMPAIWLISGIAIRFILAKVTIGRFVLLRSFRLLLPLLFGVLVIVPPQLYIEMMAKGEIALNYWQFLSAFFQAEHPIFINYQYGIWPHIDVNHLWYLRSLWFYSLALVLLMPLLNSQLVHSLVNWLSRQHGLLAVSLIIGVIFIIQISRDNSQTRYPIGFTFLLLGYLLGWRSAIWLKITKSLRPLAIAFVIGTVIFISFYNLVWLDVIQGKEVADWLKLLGMAGYSTMRVIGLLLVLSLASKLISSKSKSLSYFNEAVYPFYILHQSVILVVGYQLTQYQLGMFLEAVLLTVATVVICTILFEVIRRIELLRPCFGLKVRQSYSPTLVKLGYCASAILITPLALELLL